MACLGFETDVGGPANVKAATSPGDRGHCDFHGRDFRTEEVWRFRVLLGWSLVGRVVQFSSVGEGRTQRRVCLYPMGSLFGEARERSRGEGRTQRRV